MGTITRALASLTLVVFASCDVLSGGGDITLRVTEDRYDLNDEIRIELFNGTGDDIRADNPNFEISRATAWEHVRRVGFAVEGVPTFGAVEAVRVDAGDVHRYSHIVGDDLEAGRYRLTASVWAPAEAEESRTVISNEFTIAR